MNDKTLGALIVLVIVAAVWSIVTSSITDAERDEMLEDEEMWP